MADPLDVLTLAEAKSILGLGPNDTGSDARLGMVITAVSRRLDQAIGPIVQREVTDELHDGGEPTIWVNQRPVASFSTVAEYDGVVLTLAGEEFGVPGSYVATPYPHVPGLFAGALARYDGGCPRAWARGGRNIQVSYVAGRAEDTASVDALYKEAAALCLRNWWQADEQSMGELGEYDVPAQSFPTLAIPKAVRELLANEWQELPGIA